MLEKVKSWFITLPECQAGAQNYAASPRSNAREWRLHVNTRHSPGRGIVATMPHAA